MYKPKSPMASSKALHFSPSPQSRRKMNYLKSNNNEQASTPKKCQPVTPAMEQKP